jgi:hypothetical protein
MTQILFPANNPPHWTKTVADVIIDVEDVDETTVVVLYVFDEAEIDSTSDDSNDNDNERSDMDDLSEHKSVIAAATDRLHETGVTYEIRGIDANGTPVDAILGIVEQENIDRRYMYVYSRKRNPTGKAIFGEHFSVFS